MCVSFQQQCEVSGMGTKAVRNRNENMFVFPALGNNKALKQFKDRLPINTRTDGENRIERQAKGPASKQGSTVFRK